jgi:hypothetical protein
MHICAMMLSIRAVKNIRRPRCVEYEYRLVFDVSADLVGIQFLKTNKTKWGECLTSKAPILFQFLLEYG